MAQKTVRLLKPWSLHVRGATLTVDAPVADLLVQSGRAIAVEPQAEPTKAQPVTRKLKGRPHATN